MAGKSFFFKLNVCSKIIMALCLNVAVVGCSHDPAKVQIKELRSRPKVTKGFHIVNKGESLYSIAWQYNRDFNEIARVNGISDPYIIYPGQRIDLGLKRRVGRSPVVASKSSSKAEKIDSVKKSTAKSAKNITKKTKVSGWLWPVPGSVIETFSISGRINKGIDIRGKLGDSVKAAAAGEVVYAGSELNGYGKLVILKHNSSYLSAYAHNRELFVREGNSVKAGQKIAEIGSTGTTEPKLHFEIRRNGKPVDPMGYLPKR